ARAGRGAPRPPRGGQGQAGEGGDRGEARGRSAQAPLPPGSAEGVAEARVERAERPRVVDLERSSPGGGGERGEGLGVVRSPRDLRVLAEPRVAPGERLPERDGEDADAGLAGRAPGRARRRAERVRPVGEEDDPRLPRPTGAAL